MDDQNDTSKTEQNSEPIAAPESTPESQLTETKEPVASEISTPPDTPALETSPEPEISPADVEITPAPADTPAQEESPAEAQPEAQPETPAAPTDLKPETAPVSEQTPAPETPPESTQTLAEAEPEIASTSTPTPAPVDSSPETPIPPICKCQAIDAEKWDGQKMQLDKTFYKTFSPRIMYMPFSFAIDLDRATKGAQKKGYTVVENPMILDTMGMFLADIMIEVTGANAEDKNVVSLGGKNIYSKLSKRPWKDIKLDIADLEKELGRKPNELYAWWVSCPKCVQNKEVKAVLLAT